MTQELTDTRKKLSPFPFYEEEDILNLDAVIFTPPPLESGTIRGKLTYEEPSKPIYEEEDILNLDAVIFTPPPLESGTIRVKLTYEEPGKPIPVENPWEE